MLLAINCLLMSYVTIQNAEFKELIAADFFKAIIDVRRTDEWEAGHIPNATFVDSFNVNGFAAAGAELILDCTDCPIVVYCRSGVRSKEASEILEAANFSNVYDALGVNQWKEAGNALVTTPSATPACHQAPCSAPSPPAAAECPVGCKPAARRLRRVLFSTVPECPAGCQ